MNQVSMKNGRGGYTSTGFCSLVRVLYYILLPCGLDTVQIQVTNVWQNVTHLTPGAGQKYL